MLRSIFEIIKQLAGLSKDTQENREKLAEVHDNVEHLSDRLTHVVFEVERLKDNEAHEREKMGLRLENFLLRSGQNLLPAPASDQARVGALESQVAQLAQEVDRLKQRIETLER